MFKAVLADDEPKICQLILELGNWKKYGIEVSAVCRDGEEAYESICRIHPDIVLTDIRMPVYDGLELIRRVTEAGLHPAFIIISGYKYFDYAYSAFKFGVIDYLLKPIDREQMNEVLEKTCRILGRQQAFRRAENELQKLNEQMERSARKQMFRDMLEAGDAFPKTPEELEKKYQKHFAHPFLKLFFLRTNQSLEPDSSLLLVEKLSEALRNALTEPEGSLAGRPCLEPVHGGLACILDFEAEQESAIRSRITSFLYEARELTGLFGNTWVVIGLGRTFPAAETARLPEAAREAEEAAAARVILGGNRVIELEALHFSRIGPEQILGEGSLRSLENALEILSAETYAEVTDRIAGRCSIQPPVRPQVLWSLQNTIFDCFRAYVERQPEDMRWEELAHQWIQDLDQCIRLEDYFRCMKEQGSRCIEEWKTQKLNQEKRPIRLAKAWIEEHYSEPVSLEALAAEVGLSPAYFSTSFRQVEGRTFSDYLTAVRMQAARELLSTTNLTNTEIAARIGYADEKYFGKVFKKEVGIRPGEYRKLYQRS